MFGRTGRDDDIGPAKGIFKWLNKLARLVLFPLIHPWIFFGTLGVISAAVVLIPWLVYGIEFADMPAWYRQHMALWYQQAREHIAPLKDEAVTRYNKIMRSEVYKASQVNSKGRDDIEDYDIKPQGQRVVLGAEGNSQDELKTENVSDNTDKEAVAVVEMAAPQEEQTYPMREDDNKLPTADEVQDEAEQVYFKRNDGLGLLYVDNSEKVSGRLIVINANEVMIGTKEMFLYGIYTTLGTENARKAGAYLMENFDGKNADCYIGAYTANNDATAICIVDGVKINHTLVDLGWAQNVSLY